MEDSTPLKKAVYDFFMPRASQLSARKLEGRTPTLGAAAAAPAGRVAGLRAASRTSSACRALRHAFTGGEAMGEDTFVFYRALGVELRQLYGQTESSAFNAMQERGRGAAAHRRPAAAGRGRAHRRQRRDPGPLGLASSAATSTTRRPRARRWWTAGCTPATPVTWRPTATWSCWGGCREVVHTAQGERYIPNYIENRLKFSPYDQGRGGAGRGPRHAVGHRLHRQRAGGPLGRAARHLLHVLCRSVAEARGDRAGGAGGARTSTPRCPSR